MERGFKNKEEKDMTDKKNYCSVCKASLKKQKIRYTQSIGEKIFIVENVEAEVCPQCGEQYLSPDTVEKIQNIIESGKTPKETRQIPVYHLPL